MIDWFVLTTAILGSSLFGSIFGPLLTQRTRINAEKELKKHFQKDEQMHKLIDAISGFRVARARNRSYSASP